MRDKPLFDERYRVSTGPFKSSDNDGVVGSFLVPTTSISLLDKSKKLNQYGNIIQIVSHDGHETGWEHVSVTVNDKVTDETCTPNWQQMSVVKQAFWKPNEVVMQLHPKEDNYVDMHKDVLHLWSPVDEKIPTPPKELV
jgi:hypothetical protein